MKNTTRRILAFLAAAAMALSLTACGGGLEEAGSSAGSESIPEGKLFSDDTTVTMTIGSHNSWPYEEDWKIWQYFKEAVGGNLEVTAIPNENFITKFNLMLASPDTLPDLIHCGSKTMVDPSATVGAFISLDDNMDKMPNFTAYFDSLEDDRAQELLNQRRSGDGKIYYTPVTGTEYLTNLRTWMYRKDIFEKNGLSVPTTMDELYEVCKKLKEIYPDSYPLCFRSGLSQIDVMGPAWRSNFAHGIFYDFEKEEWCLGARELEMFDIVNYFLKMSNEGLVPPDYLNIDSKSWEALVSTNRGFIMPEYLVRLDFFNLPARNENPDFTLTIMDPPSATANDVGKIAKLNMDPTGFVICNTGDRKRIDNAIKLIDWMYSDEGSDLLSWGKEGETYEVIDGKREFILEGDETAQSAYGVCTYGLYLRMDPEAQAAAYSDEQCEQGLTAYENTETNVNPALWLAFNEEELQIINQYAAAIQGYIDEELSKFLLKQRPMSEWDAFVEGINDMNADEFIGAYESAYNRATGK